AGLAPSDAAAELPRSRRGMGASWGTAPRQPDRRRPRAPPNHQTRIVEYGIQIANASATR
ncbi:hypothetical protein, partial [Amycolatopsis sp. NPDC000740]|uniref:hypothetical protein n=1 Tax=Amycolatopsis sp. NPDC000740 TaxID=3154269 RepID=UPI0033166E03